MRAMNKEKITAWFHETFDKFLKFNKIFQFTVLISLAVTSYFLKKQSVEIQDLAVTNAYLLSESMSDNSALNESPFVWWKKEIDPFTEVIIMRDYNDAFYTYFLKGLNVDRFFYVRKEDFDVFDNDAAQVFYDEDIALYRDFNTQPRDKDGKRPMMIREFKNHFINLDGTINKGGYWRYVREDKGHIYIYGQLKEPILIY